ncbi:MAG: triple tyrosine motif-containing protein [Flavobacteriales bacterium]
MEVFREKDYQGSSQVFCFEPLSDGRMAIGNVFKLILYDGEAFEKVRTGTGTTIFSMDRDREGRIYVGGQNAMGWVVPDSSGVLKYHSLDPLLPDSVEKVGVIWKVLCDGDKVHFYTKGRIFTLKNGSFRIRNAKEHFYGMHKIDGELVVQDSGKGLFRYERDEVFYLAGSQELGEKTGEIRRILPAPQEDVWTIVSRNKGVFLYDPESGDITPFPLKSEQGKNGGASYFNTKESEWKAERIYKACRMDPDKNPWSAAYAMGSDHSGVFLVDKKGVPILRIGKERGLPSNGIWDVQKGRGGNVWVATSSGFVILRTRTSFSVDKRRSFSGTVEDIGRYGPEQVLHLATLQGVWRWNEEQKGFEGVEGMKGQCFEILEFPTKETYNSTDPSTSGREEREPGDHETLLTVSNGIRSFSVSRKGSGHAEAVFKDQVYDIALIPPEKMAKNSPPSFVAGGRRGLYILQGEPLEENGRLKPLVKVKDIPNEVRSVTVDPNTSSRDFLRVWGGMSSGGVIRVDIDKDDHGYRISQLNPSKDVSKGNVYAFQRPDKEVLFGTYGGFYEPKEGGDALGPVCKYGRSFCDGSRQISLFQIGREGRLWLVDDLEHPLKRLIPEENGYRVDSTVFRGAELGDIWAIHPEDQKVWIGGEKGLACYFPGIETNIDRDWHCRIRKVRVGTDSLMHGGDFGKKMDEGKLGSRPDSGLRVPLKEQPEEMVPTLDFSHNELEFHFAAPYFDRQDQVRYSYKLTGFDTAWSQWSKRTRKAYTNLSEGTYRFKVKARNVYKKESRTAEYRFRILPPWYRTWPAYAGYGISSVLFIWLVAWLNGRRLKAQKQRLEKIVEERTQEIRTQKEKVEEAHSRLQEAHKEITQSIDYAQKIQYALLQSEEHVSPHLPEHFILFKPQSQVSGDFYWAAEHKGYLYFAAVDCTGHGVPGAFMSMLGISQLDEIMNSDELLTPGYILTALRDRVVKELSGSDPESAAKDGMDAALVKIPIPNSQSPNGEESEIEVEFAGAQNPLYVIRKGIGEDPPSASKDGVDAALVKIPIPKAQMERKVRSKWSSQGPRTPFM